MDIKILPASLSGSVQVPESKSVTHRIIIASALSHLESAPSQIDNDSLSSIEKAMSNPSDDLTATLNCCKAMINRKSHAEVRNSGTTLRLLLPVFAALFDSFTLTSGEQLSKRPMETLTDLLNQGGTSVEKSGCSFHGNGLFKGGTYSLPGNISSQYISALLFALPLTAEGGTIYVTTELQSRPYVDLTLKVLRDFSIDIVEENHKSPSGETLTSFHMEGNQKFKSPYDDHIILEKDWSSAAFWYGANFTGQAVTLKNMDFSSLQGDKKVIEILKEYDGAADITVDARHIPDLIPVLATCAAFRPKGSKVHFKNTERLKIKESDRVKSTMDMVLALGGETYLTGNGFIVEGTDGLLGGTVESCDDHRIAMSAAIAGCRCPEGVIIKNYRCVDKSYPDFFAHLTELGGKIAEL